MEGRPSGVPWAVIFPDVDSQPRHPSQLYEAGLEGLLLLIVLGVVAQRGGFKRPGLLTGLALAGYGLARAPSRGARIAHVSSRRRKSRVGCGPAAAPRSTLYDPSPSSGLSWQ